MQKILSRNHATFRRAANIIASNKLIQLIRIPARVFHNLYQVHILWNIQLYLLLKMPTMADRWRFPVFYKAVRDEMKKTPPPLLLLLTLKAVEGCSYVGDTPPNTKFLEVQQSKWRNAQQKCAYNNFKASNLFANWFAIENDDVTQWQAHEMQLD